MVPGEAYRERVELVVEQMPVKSANGKSLAEILSDAASNDITGTDAPAPTATNTSVPTEAGAGSSETSGENPVEEVTVEDLARDMERSEAFRTTSARAIVVTSVCAVLGSLFMLVQL